MKCNEDCGHTGCIIGRLSGRVLVLENLLSEVQEYLLSNVPQNQRGIMDRISEDERNLLLQKIRLQLEKI